MEFHAIEWVKAVARWVHVFAAVLWIGQTYLFNWMEKNLTREPDAKDNVVGNLWMVHGGGFYVVEKQKFPAVMPKVLHWFKWESAVTWLSGVVLIVTTIYPMGELIYPEMKYNVGIAAGIGVILVGWVVYDVLVRTALGKNEIAFAALSVCVLMGLAYGLRLVLSPRAAFIHVGAMIGTIMTANVWMRILPAQRKILAATQEGREVDSALAATGPRRSKHNSFMVVPLVFIMISNHYPTISYSNNYSWLILGALIVGGWGVAKVMRG